MNIEDISTQLLYTTVPILSKKRIIPFLQEPVSYFQSRKQKKPPFLCLSQTIMCSKVLLLAFLNYTLGTTDLLPTKQFEYNLIIP